MDLLDVNVWVALSSPSHSHRERAFKYWHEESDEIVVFCRVTMLGFTRLLMNPRVMNELCEKPSEAWAAYERWFRDESVRFAPEPMGIEAYFKHFLLTSNVGHKGLTDTYLAAFAIAGGHRLVSFDSDFSKFEGLDFLHLRA